MFGASVRKMKAQTVKMNGEVRCIECTKLIVIYCS